MARSTYVYTVLNFHPDLLEYTGNLVKIEGCFTFKHELISYLRSQNVFDYSIQDKHLWNFYQIIRVKDGQDANIEGNSEDITNQIIQELNAK